MNPSRRCSLFLILLLLLNSSQVLAVAVHETHGHDAAGATDHDIPTGVATGAAMAMDHAALSQNPPRQPQHQDAASDEASGQGRGDDCRCAELCCASTAGFITMTGGSALPAPRSVTTPLPDYYQSVSLDLLLPPPNP